MPLTAALGVPPELQPQMEAGASKAEAASPSADHAESSSPPPLMPPGSTPIEMLHLSRLLLGGTRLGDKGAAIIASALKTNKILKVGQGEVPGNIFQICSYGYWAAAASLTLLLCPTHTPTHIPFTHQELGLGRCGITDPGVAAIFSALSEGSLVSLDLSWNATRGDGAKVWIGAHMHPLMKALGLSPVS